MIKKSAIFVCCAFACLCARPSLAQPFPDTPDNHWATQAIEELHKDGILVGYPGGLFRGGRPASRYEMAVAIASAFEHLRKIADGFQDRLNDITGMKTRGPFDSGPYKDAIAQIQDELNSMKGWGEDIANLKRLAGMFEKELTSLGLDYEQLKVDLSGLAKRVGVLETNQLPIDIHGDATFLMMGGFSNANRPGITVDGRLVGVNSNTGSPSGFPESFAIYHELALKLSSNNPKEPEWHAMVVESDMVGGFTSGAVTGTFPSQSTSAPLTGFGNGPESLYVQNAEVDLHKTVDASLGRVGYSISPYIFQRPDPNPYLKNDRWSDGLWTFDGGIVSAKRGIFKVVAFGGKQDSPVTSSGVPLQPMTIGSMAPRFTPGVSTLQPLGLPQNNLANGGSTIGLPINEHFGLQGNLQSGPLNVDLAYIWLESNQGVTSMGTVPGTLPSAANRAQVFGGDLKWNSGPFQLNGGYSQSNLYEGNTSVVDKDNNAWHGDLDYTAKKWGLGVGYRSIGALFGAPGDWGRIGTWWNPTDIQGLDARMHVGLTNTLNLSASAEWDTGLGTSVTTPAGTFAGLNGGDRISDYGAELGYHPGGPWQLSLGAELVYWNLENRNAFQGSAAFLGGKPTERWYNLGFGYSLGDNAKFNLLWQFSDDTPGLNSLS
ncbi:MAG TPA: S-layer homology domain-containing protein, partial [Fimbriimonadaceae bacterium]